MNESRPANRRGVPRSYIIQVLGEPTLTDSNKTEWALTAVALWKHDWNDSKVPCTAVKMVPPDRDDVPGDDWFVTPCHLHEHLFAQFPEAPVGTPMWGEDAADHG